MLVTTELHNGNTREVSRVGLQIVNVTGKDIYPPNGRNGKFFAMRELTKTVELRGQGIIQDKCVLGLDTYRPIRREVLEKKNSTPMPHSRKDA
jgi:hypothetical protein